MKPLRSHPVLRRVAALLVSSFLASVLAAPVLAAKDDGPSIWLASGPEGGTYRAVYGANLASLLRGTSVFFRPSAGSADNVALLRAGQADVAFVQADVFAAAHALGETADLQVIGRLSDECVYVARRDGGDVQSFDDLRSPPGGEPATVAVGPPDGGPAGTWRWLSERAPEIAGNVVDDQGGTLALNQLAVGRFDAVVWVTDPLNLEHKMLQATLRNDALSLMPVTDAALLEPLSDGTVVYEKKKVALTDGWRSKKLETICTPALVLMRRDADRALVERISDLVGLKRDLIAPRKER
jgi:hypothetical protein